MTAGTAIALTGIIVALSGAIIALVYNSRKDKREDTNLIKEAAFQEAKIIVKLEEIGADVKDIKYDITETKKEVHAIDKRVTLVERTLDSLHNRLDEHIQQKGV